MLIVSITLSVCALLFTIFSFWLMNWRKGKLHAFPPPSFAAFGSKHAKLVLELPLVFYNDGPLPIIIRDLKLIINNNSEHGPLSFVATVTKLGTDEQRAYSTQIPVGGRESVSRICEFQRNPGNLLFEAKSYKLELYAKLDDDYKWKKISFFNLDVAKEALATINTSFITHYNSQT